MFDINVFTLVILASMVLGALITQAVEYFFNDKKIDQTEATELKEAILKQLTILITGIKSIDMPKEDFKNKIIPEYVGLIFNEIPSLEKAGFTPKLVSSIIEPVIDKVYDEYVKLNSK